MSRVSDIAGIRDDTGKGSVPKGISPAGYCPGYTVKSCMTVIV